MAHPVVRFFLRVECHAKRLIGWDIVSIHQTKHKFQLNLPTAIVVAINAHVNKNTIFIVAYTLTLYFEFINLNLTIYHRMILKDDGFY